MPTCSPLETICTSFNDEGYGSEVKTIKSPQLPHSLMLNVMDSKAERERNSEKYKRNCCNWFMYAPPSKEMRRCFTKWKTLREAPAEITTNFSDVTESVANVWKNVSASSPVWKSTVSKRDFQASHPHQVSPHANIQLSLQTELTSVNDNLLIWMDNSGGRHARWRPSWSGLE